MYYNYKLKLMSKSRRFQPYPSTTTDKTRNTVNRCVGMEKEGCEGDKQEKVTLLLSLASILLVYYWLLINL